MSEVSLVSTVSYSFKNSNFGSNFSFGALIGIIYISPKILSA